MPARAVPDAVRDCVAKRVPAAVIFSSGFGEEGKLGRAVEAAVDQPRGAAGLWAARVTVYGAAPRLMEGFVRIPA